MISIGKPFVTVEGQTAYLRAQVRVSEDTARIYLEKTGRLNKTTWLTAVDYPPSVWNRNDFSLWFSAPAEYAEHLCTQRSNAFVMALLWYAMMTGSDISFQMPLSARLFEGLTKRLLPALLDSEGKRTELSGPVTDKPVECAGGVLTGMSCGVDSLYTLRCYDRSDAPEGRRLTHLAFYDCNSLLPSVEPPYDVSSVYRQTERVTAQIIGRAKTIAEQHCLPLIVMRSNIDEDFYRGAEVYGAMYRYLTCTLALEPLFSTYISSSSGHDTSALDVCLTAPSQHYEGLICESCQTESLSYVTSDNVSRPEKLLALSDDEEAQRSLAVCFNTGPSGENCGRCYGCMKTMIPLDIMGKLDRFGACFDLQSYFPRREEVFRDLIAFSHRPEASSARQSVQQFLQLADRYDGEAGRLFRACAKGMTKP